eukprot:g4298.t1
MLRSELNRKEPLRVLDLGSGCGSLRKYLRRRDVYVPSDIVQRKFPVLQCDYNRGFFPRISDASVVVALGVVEYMCNVSSFLESIASYDVPTIVSYTFNDLKHPKETISLANTLSPIVLERKIRDAGFVLRDRRYFDVRFNARTIPQVLYFLTPVQNHAMQKRTNARGVEGALLPDNI